MSAWRLDSAESTLLDAVRPIRWPSRRVVRDGHNGAHLARILGRSPEFTEYRAYRQGDEIRRVDWKLLGRTDRAYIRLAQDRALLPTMLLVDASASMAYPEATLEKWEYSRRLALGLAAVAHLSGDPVGLLVADGPRARRLEPRSRRGVIQEIAAVLREVKPAGTSALAPHLAAARRVGRLAIVSDFLGDADALPAAAGQLAAQGREVYAIHVIHESEANPPYDAAILTDPEDPHLRRPMLEATREEYRARFTAWCDELARGLTTRGGYYRRVVTSEPVANAVRRIAR